MPVIEVCLSPALFPFLKKRERVNIVVIDILRATTSFCTAFDYGAHSIVPLGSIEEAKQCKEAGDLVAAERDGLKPDFADFNNSAFDYMVPAIKGKTIYYTTTNGTQAIETARKSGTVYIGSFLNAPALAKHLEKEKDDVILLCSGWKNNPCIEDTLCAGLIADILIQSNSFTLIGDSAKITSTLWEKHNTNLKSAIIHSEHYTRLEKLGYGDILDYSLKVGHSNSVPVLIDNKLINLNS